MHSRRDTGLRPCRAARALGSFRGMQEEPPPVRRRGLALALVVLASLAAFLAVMAIWVSRQVLDTDNWTDASSELLERPVIRDRVAGFLTDQLYENVDVEGQIAEALPDRADRIAGPVAGALRNEVEDRAREALSRDDVQRLWENANRAAHIALLRLLEGGGEAVSTEGDAVILDLHALLEATQERAGFGGRAAEALPEDAGRVEILRADELDSAQRISNTLKALPIVLVVLSLALFGAALLVAPGWRRRALRAYGVGFVAAGAAALAAKSLAGDALVDGLARTASGEPVVRAVYDIYTPLLEQAATATIGYGVVMIAGAWLAGPTRIAVAIRRGLAPYMREPVIVYSAVALLVAIVLFWWAPTPATRNPATATLLVALLVLGVEGLRRKTLREFPDADRESAARSRRELFERARAGSGAVVRRESRFSAGEPAADEMRLERLERLGQLRAAGVLDEDELRAEKARVLAGEKHAGTAVAAPPADA
jgi:hypothetical protein